MIYPAFPNFSWPQRNITTDQNAAFNGKYTFTVHLFSFAYRYSF
jgi:hypothetical protein